MSVSEDIESSKVVTLRSQVAQFWVVGNPYFSTTVLFEPVEEPVELRLFDPDGEQINQATIQFSSGKVGVLELDALIAACKTDSGMKHGRLEVHSSQMVSLLCRIHSKESAAFAREAMPFSAARKLAIPVTFGDGRSCLIAFLNRHDHAVEVRGRLFAGNRAPEATWSVPARGVRLVDANTEFSSFIELGGEATRVAYLRTSVVGDHEVSMEVLESASSAKQARSFCIVS